MPDKIIPRYLGGTGMLAMRVGRQGAEIYFGADPRATLYAFDHGGSVREKIPGFCPEQALREAHHYLGCSDAFESLLKRVSDGEVATLVVPGSGRDLRFWLNGSFEFF
ncbi:MAG: hypothetical protein ABH864_02700 [archaeon]